MPSLQQFKRLTGSSGEYKQAKHWKPPVTLREKLIIGTLVSQFFWLAFAMGGANWWAERIGFALAVFAFILLVIPLPGQHNDSESKQPRAIIIRLLCFPPFWLGWALITYIWIQSWNIEWVYTHRIGGGRQMIWQQPIDWLPSGIVSPLEQSNPFRGMIYLMAPWLSFCVLWAGVHSRRGLQLFLHALGVIFFAWGIAALYQHFNNIEQILGIWDTHPKKQGSDIPFWGTLVNENHGAFFLLLGAGFSLGLFMTGCVRAARSFRFGGWHLLYFVLALFLSFAAAQAESRGAAAMTIVLWIGFLFICSTFIIRFFGWKGAILPIAVLAIFLTFVLISISNPDRFERLKSDYEKTIGLSENPEIEGRYFMYRVTSDMIASKPWFGYGAGSFRFIYLRYASDHGELAPTYRVRVVDAETGRARWETRNLWFTQAHLDLSEFIIEWGIVGCSFVWLSWMWGIGYLVRYRKIVDHGQVTIIWTGIVLLIGAAWEFHFRIPLLPLAWCLIMTTALKTVHLRRKSLL